MDYLYTVTCLVCREFATLVDITPIDDSSSLKPWSRVIMGCGDTVTLPSVDAVEIGRVGNGTLASATLHHPDVGGDEGFIIIWRGDLAP
jgi:hypothetical protein